MTYRVDPDPRSHNVLKAKLAGNVITTEPANVNITVDPYIVPAFHFTNTHIRLEIASSGLKGFLGGYQPWYPMWYGTARAGYITEYAASIDVPGLYYALKKLADADPDPKTGENRSISLTYAVEAVPAFVTTGDIKSALLP